MEVKCSRAVVYPKEGYGKRAQCAVLLFNAIVGFSVSLCLYLHLYPGEVLFTGLYSTV